MTADREFVSTTGTRHPATLVSASGTLHEAVPTEFSGTYRPWCRPEPLVSYTYSLGGNPLEHLAVCSRCYPKGRTE